MSERSAGIPGTGGVYTGLRTEPGTDMVSPIRKQQEFVQLRAPSSRVCPVVLPDEEAEEQAEEEADNNGGNAATEAGPIPLEHRSCPGLVHDSILVGLTISSVLPGRLLEGLVMIF